MLFRSFSAGVKVLLDHEAGSSGLSSATAVATLSIPVSVFLLGVWLLILRLCLRGAYKWLFPVGALLVGCAPLLAQLTPTAEADVQIAVVSVLGAAAVMVLLVVLIEASGVRERAEPAGAPAAG